MLTPHELQYKGSNEIRISVESIGRTIHDSNFQTPAERAPVVHMELFESAVQVVLRLFKEGLEAV